MPETIWQPLLEAMSQAEQMRATDRYRKQELDMEQIRATAEQHWRESEAQHQQALEQEAAARGERQDKLAEERIRADRAREDRLNREGAARDQAGIDKLEQQNQIAENTNILKIVNELPKTGYVTGAAALTPGGQERLKATVYPLMMKDYNEQLNKAVTEELAKLPPADPVQTVQQAMTGDLANPSGTLPATLFSQIGAAATAGQNRAQLEAQAHMEAVKKVGVPPTPDDYLTWEHPAARDARLQKEAQTKLTEANTVVANVKAKREEFLQQFDKPLMEAKIAATQATVTRTEAYVKNLSDQNTNRQQQLAWKKYIDEKHLEDSQKRLGQADFRLRLDNVRLGLMADHETATNARAVATAEDKMLEPQIKAQRTHVTKLQHDLTMYQGIAKDIPPDAKPTDLVASTATASSPAVTVAHVQLMVTALDKELKEAAPKLQSDMEYQKHLRQVVQGSGMDAARVGRSGVPQKPGVLAPYTPTEIIPGAPDMKTITKLQKSEARNTAKPKAGGKRWKVLPNGQWVEVH